MQKEIKDNYLNFFIINFIFLSFISLYNSFVDNIDPNKWVYFLIPLISAGILLKKKI